MHFLNWSNFLLNCILISHNTKPADRCIKLPWISCYMEPVKRWEIVGSTWTVSSLSWCWEQEKVSETVWQGTESDDWTTVSQHLQNVRFCGGLVICSGQYLSKVIQPVNQWQSHGCQKLTDEHEEQSITNLVWSHRCLILKQVMLVMVERCLKTACWIWGCRLVGVPMLTNVHHWKCLQWSYKPWTMKQ